MTNRLTRMLPGRSAQATPSQAAGPLPAVSVSDEELVDLQRRRDDLSARVAELQWDLGGLVYEMAVRDRIRVDVLVKRAAVLQDADSELGEVERILRLEQTAAAGSCTSCGAPHSTGAAFCWQCGTALMAQRPRRPSARAAANRSGRRPAGREPC